MNQLVLAPLVLVVVFSWNLGLQGQAGQIRDKIRRDFTPSLMNGGRAGRAAAGRVVGQESFEIVVPAAGEQQETGSMVVLCIVALYST